MTQRINCYECDGRILNYRRPLNCTICHHTFHYKCQQLSKRHIENIFDMENQNFWTCRSCTANIFPLINENIATTTSTTEKIGNIKCNSCLKILGKKHTKCDTCNELVHKRCSAGALGCKKCARETFPGYDYLTEIFNPFSHDSEINNICASLTNEIQGTDLWNTISHNLENCKYTELKDISPSRDSELKVLSLNISSLKKHLHKIIDKIDQYQNFDVLCFNETSCDPEKLPFGATELTLEGFHDPVLQKPCRDSTRGGGLAIYVNKNMCAETSIKTLNELSSADDPSLGEFLFVEIDMGKNAKNIVLDCAFSRIFEYTV